MVENSKLCEKSQLFDPPFYLALHDASFLSYWFTSTFYVYV